MRRDTGFVYLARGLPSARAARIAHLQIPGIQLIPRQKADAHHVSLCRDVHHDHDPLRGRHLRRRRDRGHAVIPAACGRNR